MGRWRWCEPSRADGQFKICPLQLIKTVESFFLAQIGFAAFGKGVQLINGCAYERSEQLFREALLKVMYTTGYCQVANVGRRR